MTMIILCIIGVIWIFCALNYVIKNFFEVHKFNLFEKCFVFPIMFPLKAISFLFGGNKK